MEPYSPEYASETKGPRILGVFWSFFTLSTVLVSARLYIRARVLQNIGPEDYMIIGAMVMVATYTVIGTVDVYMGYGRHTVVIMQEGGMDLLERVLLINYINFAFGIMSFTSPKLAIAALLNRILNPSRFHRIGLWALTGLVFMSSSILIVVLFTMCDPPKALWQIHLVATGATCRPMPTLIGYAIFTGAASGFVDLYLAIYPTVVLIKLQMSLQKKMALCAVLGFGAIAAAMAIVKCFQLPGLNDKTDPTCTRTIPYNPDIPADSVTDATADLVIWTSVESNIIIIASCIPTLGPLYEMFRGKRSWSSKQRYYKSSKQLPSDFFDRAPRKPMNSLDPRVDYMTTNVGVTKHDSQENILQSEEYSNGSLPLGMIHRRDDVCVEYNNAPHTPDPAVCR